LVLMMNPALLKRRDDGALEVMNGLIMARSTMCVSGEQSMESD